MAISERVARVEQMASARRERERRALRLLALPLLAVVVIPTLTSRPHLSSTGTGLVKLLALAVLVAAFVAIRARGRALDDGEHDLAPTTAAIVGVGAAAVALVYVQPSGSGALALSLVAYVSGARLPLRTGIFVTGLATAAVVVASVLTPGSEHTISTTSSILLAILLFVTARIYRRAEDDRLRAEIATAELADARERELESAALDERGRIARELHDVLAHSLSGLSLQLEGARLLAERDGSSPELKEAIARSRRLASDGLEEAKRAVSALRGEALPGLDDLPRLVDDFDAGELHVELTARGDARPIPKQAALTLYRAAQEALTNVIRHSGAHWAEVEVEYGADTVRLIVTNHAAPDATAALTDVGSGYGLSAMSERAALVGGQVSAGPTGDGFRVEVTLPV